MAATNTVRSRVHCISQMRAVKYLLRAFPSFRPKKWVHNACWLNCYPPPRVTHFITPTDSDLRSLFKITRSVFHSFRIFMIIFCGGSFKARLEDRASMATSILLVGGSAHVQGLAEEIESRWRLCAVLHLKWCTIFISFFFAFQSCAILIWFVTSATSFPPY